MEFSSTVIIRFFENKSRFLDARYNSAAYQEVIMKEGNHAILWIGDDSYDVTHYKVKEKVENYFCGTLDLKLNEEPDVDLDEPYSARLIVNGDAVWHFPWVWFKKVKNGRIEASTHGGIFCPLGLTEEDEAKYDSLNLIIASDACYSMTSEVWKNLLEIFADWLKSKSVPQYQEYLDLATEIDIDDDDDFDDDDEDDEDEDDDEDDYEEDDEEDEEDEDEDEDDDDEDVLDYGDDDDDDDDDEDEDEEDEDEDEDD
jgi:hypothetical protein